MKKRLSLLLVLCLACFCLAAVAEAPLAAPSGLECYWNDGEFEPGPHYDGVLWASDEVGATHAYVLLEDGTAEIVDMTYYGYWIPETVDGIPVTAIGTLGITDRLDSPSELEIPAWITQISEDVLRWARHDLFTGVDPANPYFTLENGMLYDLRNRCLIAYLEDGPCALPADTERIGCRAFAGCGIDRIDLPEGLARIGGFAFTDCENLVSVTIPDSVTEIGDNPFTACGSLQDIVISPDHPLYGFRDGMLYRKDNMEIISVLPAYARGVWTMPEWAKSLGPYALSGNDGLTEVRLHEGVTDIPQGAFAQCVNLTDIVLPEGIETIGTEAFRGCASLKKIGIPGSVREMGIIAFGSCYSLEEVRFAEGLKVIPAAAFSHCGQLQTVVLPQGLEFIGNSAFFSCSSLAGITIPDSVTAIEFDAFSDCTNLTVTAEPDSPAIRYCLEENIPFVLSGTSG